MSSEHPGAAQNQQKGNLGGAWDILSGSQGEYTDLGVARRFGGSAAAYSLRDVGAMNGRVVKVRREQDTTPVDFSAGAIASGGVEQFAIGQSVLDKYNDAAYFPADSAYFSVTNIDLTGSFTITVSFIFTGDENVNQQTLFWGNAGKDTIAFTDYSTFRFRRDGDNKTLTLDSDIKKNTLHTLVVTRDGSNVVSVSIDGVTQSNTVTEAGTYKIERMGFRNRGTEFDININGVAAYTGDGADASNWTDTLGSNDATKVGAPVAFTGQGISAFVDTWYDQSGNGRDVAQSTTSLQPKIISDGSLVTLNSKPAVSFAGDGVRLSVARFLTTQGNTYFSAYDVTNSLYPSQSGVVIRQGANYRISQSILTGGNVGKIQSQVRDGGGDSASSNTSSSFDGQTILQTTIISATRGADGIKTFVNSTNEATADTTDVQDVDFSTVSDVGNNALFIGSIDTGGFDFLGNLGEVVLFSTDIHIYQILCQDRQREVQT
jgi:hypothetical protein